MMIIESERSRLRDLLSMLREGKGEGGEEKEGKYVSGEYISRALDISREAVWKYISMLRRRYGYRIDAKPRVGYMLVHRPDKLYPWEIMLELGRFDMVKEIIYYEEVESTQDVALRLAEQGRDSILVVAERQSRGRGRASRRWISPDGGVWFSLIIKPRISVRDVTLFSLATALAVCNTINGKFNFAARIKWPNDVIINYKKVAGILIDMSIEHDAINYAVVGIGVNANVSIDSIERMIGYADKSHYYGSTSLMHELGKAVDRVRLLASLLRELEHIYSRLAYKDEMLAAIRATIMLGPVRVIEGEGNDALTIEGVAIDVDDDGSLLVKSDGMIKKVTSGYVHVRYVG
ncbi:biotin--[acetyl-CoA-carboxylase] ligase [Candidatus Nitrosocaldus cavascurensis]|jgi:BirA family biotin operon repressor/biotin-[acetyl-CoA-carboxylase] ligase|nr:biotin--[acetyl-CoA-carboxylase] ligase [Candidatus Nitrosocaldus cavascurensis]